jgi:hypothetical protein
MAARLVGAVLKLQLDVDNLAREALAREAVIGQREDPVNVGVDEVAKRLEGVQDLFLAQVVKLVLQSSVFVCLSTLFFPGSYSP